jgi:hypothetical protein
MNFLMNWAQLLLTIQLEDWPGLVACRADVITVTPSGDYSWTNEAESTGQCDLGHLLFYLYFGKMRYMGMKRVEEE